MKRLLLLILLNCSFVCLYAQHNTDSIAYQQLQGGKMQVVVPLPASAGGTAPSNKGPAISGEVRIEVSAWS